MRTGFYRTPGIADTCSGTTAIDESNNRYNGTINPASSGNTSAGTCRSGTATEMWSDGTNGKFNASLGFDGIDDSVNLKSPTVLDNLDTYTISTWVYANSLPSSNWTDIVVKAGAGQTESYLLYINNEAGANRLATWIGHTTTPYAAQDNAAFPTGRWVHIVSVGSITANVLPRLYMDGVEISSYHTRQLSSGSRTSDAAADLFIGSETNPPATGGEFDGLIDDVRIYNYALTPTQVRTVYNEGAAIRFGPLTGSP